MTDHRPNLCNTRAAVTGPRSGGGPGPTPPDPDAGLTTRARRRVMAQVRAEERLCHLCGWPVDLTLDRQRHPLGSCGDELIPRADGGDPEDRANVRHAHRLCNGIRGRRPITTAIRIRCRTAVAELLGATPPERLSRRW